MWVIKAFWAGDHNYWINESINIDSQFLVVRANEALRRMYQARKLASNWCYYRSHCTLRRERNAPLPPFF